VNTTLLTAYVALSPKFCRPMNWIDSHSRVDEGVAFGDAGPTPCFLRTIWRC